MMERIYASLSDEQLSNLLESAKSQFRANINEYTDKINALLNEFLPSWYVCRLTDSICELERKSETMFFKVSNTPMTYDIQIYHGKNYWETGRNRFELNISARGSFSILGDNDIKQYYLACGVILSNNVFNLELESLLIEFYEKYQVIKNYLSEIQREIQYREDTRKDEEAKAIIKEKFDKYLPSFNGNLEGKYVVLKKSSDSFANCYYRKAPFTLESSASSENECYSVKRLLQTENRYAEFKIIPANKVKFN